MNALARFVAASGVFICWLPMAGLSDDRLTELKVEGNHLMTVSGRVVRLHGVDVPSLEWSQGDHLSNSLAVASEWGANIVRLPLSEDRWFGHTREKNDGGEHYRKTIEEFVADAVAKKCYVILDLHWSDCNVWGKNIGQHNMPDDNSVAFWEEVSAAYANNSAVLFDLYNEPHDISWEVWRNGGHITEKSKDDPDTKFEYHTPGMQKLLEVCRNKGARNVVVAGGLDWAYDLRGVAKGYALEDTNGNGVVYDTHIYPMKTWYTHGNTKSQDWDRIIMVANEKYPVMIGEFGSGKGNYEKGVIDFAKENDLPWVAWCLHPRARPCLIKDWDYTPTDFGAVVKEALHDEAQK